VASASLAWVASVVTAPSLQLYRLEDLCCVWVLAVRTHVLYCQVVL
jgi:hypothetical protein